ncbi:hypothetical protein K469DRAFT_570023, partial [Zopfia rhizophila CBS 207.26]
FTRRWIAQEFGLYDILIATAVLLGAAQTATIILQVQHGHGGHAAELSIDQNIDTLMFKWINLIIYFRAIWVVKMSILTLFHRIGSGMRGFPWILHSLVVWVISIFTTLFAISTVLAKIFTCTPISRPWDVERLPTGCVYADGFNITQASINVFTDFVLLILSMPLARLLEVTRKQRGMPALVVIFSIGVIPLAASVKRLSVVLISAVGKGETWLNADTSWKWAYVPLWSQIEVDVGIMAASLPSLTPLLKQMWSGFIRYKSMTPSRIRTLTRPRESWGL